MTVIFPIETQNQRSIIACGIAFSLLPATVVFLRVLARRKANRPLDSSDYLIIIAGVLAVAYQAVVISSVLTAGVGFHVADIERRFGLESGDSIFMKHLVAMQVFWGVTLALCRISIIHLFTKIFVVQSFVMIARATYVLIILWALAAVFSAFLICQPFEYTWNKSIEGGTCGNFMLSWIATGILNMVSDLIILIMPMPYLMGLELALPKRLILTATFGIGIFTCVVSIIRLVMISEVDFDDITYTIPHTVLFSALEPCVAITLACVIILRPLFGGQYSSDGTATYEGQPTETIPRTSNRHFKQLNDDSSETRLRPEEVGYRATIAKSPNPFKGLGNTGDAGLEMGSISIQHEWTVEEELRPTSSSVPKDKN
ncbi:hypothetical protein GGR52DRAFT_577276 [Hypoxylon sp. FL1284]|nr:hypothetical protein GGR52DRAFT_577276 [Hypoxylon sp. FL1284]